MKPSLEIAPALIARRLKRQQQRAIEYFHAEYRDLRKQLSERRLRQVRLGRDSSLANFIVGIDLWVL